MVKWPNMQPAQDIKPRKKICFVITKGVWGGAQKYVFSLTTSLPKNQFDVVVITGPGDILKNKLEKQNIKTYEISSLKRDLSIFEEFVSSLTLLKIVWKEGPDILHLNSPKASGFGSVAGRLVGTKNIIQTIHGWTFNEDRKIFTKTVIWFFSWITTMLCHKTIVIAEKELRQAIKMPFCKRKIILIKNGVEPVLFKERFEAKKELYSLCEGQTFVEYNKLWVGTISELHKNKGLEYAIRAMAKIEIPFIFFIIGEGEERDNLEKLIRKYNLENKVFLVGFLDNANQYLKAFDVFTLTSIKEGLPYTILEAGLAGLPVIASSVGGIPDIIENNMSGMLVEKTSVEQVIKAIEFMIDNPEQRKIFGQKLQEKVEKEFSLKQMLEKTVEVYK
ncbi:MAG: glycosyltransferase [Candidatus Paceibacterota bacterium]|jgi:glycosyltransferase involved in cell wall biosynthesis